MYRRHRAPDPERDFAYSEWHRPESISRFIPMEQARDLHMMDLDGVEIDRASGAPCAYIETTERAVDEKPSCWTQAIAAGAPAPGYLVQTLLSEHLNPEVRWGPVKDIVGFVVRRLGDGSTRKMTPEQYAKWLVTLRSRPTTSDAPAVAEAR